jgi:hypothetical protein
MGLRRRGGHRDCRLTEAARQAQVLRGRPDELRRSRPPPEVERKRFLDALERFRPSHLRLLGVLLLPPENLGDGSTDGYLLARMPGAEIEHVRLDWADLQAAAMVGNYPSGLTNTSKPQLVAQSLRDFGRRFAAFIEAGASVDDVAPDEGPSP